MSPRSGISVAMYVKDGVKSLIVSSVDKTAGFYFRYYPDGSWNCFLKEESSDKYVALDLITSMRLLSHFMSGFPGFADKPSVH